MIDQKKRIQEQKKRQNRHIQIKRREIQERKKVQKKIKMEIPNHQEKKIQENMKETKIKKKFRRKRRRIKLKWKKRNANRENYSLRKNSAQVRKTEKMSLAGRMCVKYDKQFLLYSFPLHPSFPIISFFILLLPLLFSSF